MKIEFLNGMQIRGLTPVDNSGGGNCVFMSLAKLVFGDATRFDFMRYMIVHRLRSFPEKYFYNTSDSPTYCNNMLIPGKPATPKELQAAADIFFSVIECYFIEDSTTPANITYPLRLATVSAENTNILRLWTYRDQCMPLVELGSRPLIQNIFEEEHTQLQVSNLKDAS